MTTHDFSLVIRVPQSPEVVFEAVLNPRAWWSEEITGGSSKEGDEFYYHYKDVHRCHIRIASLIPNQRVEWTVLENYFSFTKNPAEWTGNSIVFEISTDKGDTVLKMTHVGLSPEEECYDACSSGWTNYIQNSLYKLITTGKGDPITKEGNDFENSVDRDL